MSHGVDPSTEDEPARSPVGADTADDGLPPGVRTSREPPAATGVVSQRVLLLPPSVPEQQRRLPALQWDLEDDAGVVTAQCWHLSRYPANVLISWVLAGCLVMLGGSVPVAAGGSALVLFWPSRSGGRLCARRS